MKFVSLIAALFGGVVYAANPPPPPSQATPTQISAGLQINACGDSLTAGGQDGNGGNYPGELFADSNVPVNNFGISGQLSTQIAMRCGAVQIPLTLSGNAITAGGALNTITAINGVSVTGTNTAQSPDYRFLSTSGDNGTRILYGSLCGTHGYVRRNASGGPPSTSETYAYFIDYANGLNSQTQSISCPALSVFTPDSVRNLGQGMVFEGGRNNYTATSVVESDWNSVASAQPSTNYLMLTILNGDYTNEQSGQTNYNTIITDNTFLTGTYPNNSWDWRSWLISQYNSGNVVDVLNHTNDVIPYTLRAQVGAGTLNGSITSSGCPTLTPTSGTPAASQTLKIDSEYIYVLTLTGNVVNTCTRGYGTGGTAASHSNGAAYTAVDPLHLSSAAYNLVGDYINTNYIGLLNTPAFAKTYLSPQKWANVIGDNPPPLGSVYAPTLIGGPLFTGGAIHLPYGQFLQTSDGSANGGAAPGITGNIVNIVRYVNNQLQFGGGFVSSLAMGTGGTGGLQALIMNNDGTVQIGSGLTNAIKFSGSNTNPSINTTAGSLVIVPTTQFSSLSASAPVVSTDANKALTTTAPMQSANTIYAGPNTGAAASPTFRTLVGADLPNPAASTLGGVESLAVVSHQFMTGISTSGVPSQAQPAFSDISGTATAGQMPSGVNPVLSGTSGSIGGGALLAGACATGTLTVTGATTSMIALTDPNTYPGDGAYWDAYVSSANTVTVKVCAVIALTPTASTYNVRVIQ